MTNNQTKQKVMEAACRLFYAKGYHGTSVRDIAHSASVNVSLISYYFKSKQGLLESIVTSYYEQYLTVLEETMTTTEAMPKIDRLKQMIATIIHYKQEQHQFTCFIHRELSLDSVFVREMMVTYLAKENHLINSVFKEALRDSGNTKLDLQFLYVQLKGLLNSPYSSANEWKTLVNWNQSQEFFAKKYVHLICRWIDHLSEGTEMDKKSKPSILSR
ncbi:forespore capture DNA-binding protein RefZ [Sediminibacillus halophilus]|uniref:DNA-binding transcriptional regulator, AcrR family n=1 Tax=Sediminibacillus halophilus TaxID=482461 RepID=A0A1G9Y5J8_9BACI|nr:forespore capture DNA-binding protein RefZ [Sediminibacillus halophilus]SDN04359.1 DNA-binding transcriptional regulator, AcrR family [Sediminibacillus halophilus]